MGVDMKREEQTKQETEKVLRGISEKIQKNVLLREVFERERRDYSDLIQQYGAEKVMMAVELVESYRLILEIRKNCEE